MIFQIIEELRSNNSRLFKESVLERNQDNELLKRVFRMTLDPFTQYNIKKIPQHIPSGTESLSWALDQLEPLVSRKYTGNAGINHLHHVLSCVSPQDAKIIVMVVERDLDCGVSRSTVNKIWPGLIYERVYMRCSGFKDIKKAKINWGIGVYSQIKSDGIFCSVSYGNDGEVVFATRAGKKFENFQFQNIIKELKEFSPTGRQYHGELLVKRDGEILPRQTGNGILNSVSKGGSFAINEEPFFVCWDNIPLELAVPDSVVNIPYDERFHTVIRTFSKTYHIAPAETKMVFSHEEAMEHYTELVDAGHEGSIIKTHDAFWKDGTSKQQFKVKVDFNVELRAIALNPGDGKYESTFGSVKCISEDGLLEVNVSGITDEMRDLIFSQQDLVNDGQMIIEVKSNCITKPKKEGGKHSLFHPRFVEIRTDKTEADTLQRIFDQYESIVRIQKNGA